MDEATGTCKARDLYAPCRELMTALGSLLIGTSRLLSAALNPVPTVDGWQEAQQNLGIPLREDFSAALCSPFVPDKSAPSQFSLNFFDGRRSRAHGGFPSSVVSSPAFFFLSLFFKCSYRLSRLLAPPQLNFCHVSWMDWIGWMELPWNVVLE